MLNEARFFSHDERSLRGYLIEDIEKKKLKAEELLNIESTNVKTKNKHLNKHEKKTKNK